MSAGHNAFGGTLKDVKANVCPDPVAVPDSVRGARFPVRVETEQLADGVYLLGGAHPQQRRRRVRQLHRRLRSAAQRSAKPRGDRGDRQADSQQADPLRRQFAPALRSRRRAARLHAHRRDHHHALEELRLLQPRLHQLHAADAAARHGVAVAADRSWPRATIYETVRENYVLTDGTRTMHIYYVNPLQHAEGMLMAYLPKEKMLIEADLVDTLRAAAIAHLGRSAQLLQRGAETEARCRATRSESRSPDPVGGFRHCSTGTPEVTPRTGNIRSDGTTGRTCEGPVRERESSHHRTARGIVGKL